MSLTVGLEVTINHLRFGQDMDSIELRAHGGEVKQHYAEEACRPRRHAGKYGWGEGDWELLRKSVRRANNEVNSSTEFGAHMSARAGECNK